MVLIISEIWLTDTPRIAGPISFITRQTPLLRKETLGSTSMPIFQVRQLIGNL